MVVVWMIIILCRWFGVGENMANMFTDLIAKYQFMSDIAVDEKFESKAYVLGKEPHRTIGFGHYIEDESAYTRLAKRLQFKDKENLTEEEASKLLYLDINSRRWEMAKEYPSTPDDLRNIMLNVRMQFEPSTFKKHFGDNMDSGNIKAVKAELKRLGNVFKKRKQGGVAKRWNRVSINLDSYAKGLKEE